MVVSICYYWLHAIKLFFNSRVKTFKNMTLNYFVRLTFCYIIIVLFFFNMVSCKQEIKECPTIYQDVLRDVVIRSDSNVNLSSELIPLNLNVLNSILKTDELLKTKVFNLKNIDTNTFRLNCNSFNKVTCIDKEVTDSILSIKDTILNTDSGLIVISPWNEFRKNYGYGGIHRYSIPFYNEKHNLFVMEHIVVSDVNVVGSEFLVFHKNDKNSWVFLKSINWFSSVTSYTGFKKND